jgi:TolB-like protein/DNA-binding SARP family transcriptional activator
VLASQRKALALLALLADAGDRGISRDRVVAYLWPDSDEERARTALRQLVHVLRTLSGEPDLVVTAPELRLDASVVTSDVAEFRSADALGDSARAVALYVGPFLDGFYLRGADEFERWVATERASLATRVSIHLERLANSAAEGGDPAEAAALWRRAATIEPLSARAAVGLMQALDALGERAAALRHARVYEALVRDEVGGAPDATVSALAERLRMAGEAGPLRERTAAPDGPPARADAETRAPPSGRTRHSKTVARMASLLAGLAVLAALWAFVARDRVAGGADAGAGATDRAIASVAVLPFENTGGAPEDEPLAVGLTDELIGVLGRVPELRVVGRTSVYALRGRGLGARALGDTLGVASVVEASVRRAGDRIRVGAQLVRVSDGVVLWSETYERTLADVFAMQAEIARSIAVALRHRLAMGQGPRRAGTTDPEAYDLYLRGRYIFYSRPDREGVEEAERYFVRASARDTAFALAHAGLSDVHTRRAVFGFGPPKTEFAAAVLAAERALLLDSTLAEAHTSLAHARCVADFDWRGAERSFRRALALNPGYGFARLPFAICLSSEGRFPEAIAQLDTARAADPLAAAPINVLGRIYVAAGHPERAIGVLKEALALNPVLDLAYQQLGHAYLRLGRHGEAIAAMQRAAALNGVRDSAHLAYAYAVTGNRSSAEQILRELIASASRRFVPPYHVAVAYAGLRDDDAAFAWLERGYAERASFMNGLMMDPAFEPLHPDPRWAELLRRMRLSPSGAAP